jgi:hypothetical protein
MATATKTVSTEDLISTGKVAHLLNCSSAYVLALTRSGFLSAQLIDNRHYFSRSAVEKFATARAARTTQPSTERTTDSAPTFRHHGASIVGILRENSAGPRITTRDVNNAHFEFYSGDADERSTNG